MSQLKEGVSFPDAMKAVAAAVISSPRFLDLYDGGHHAEGLELASRLALFLWGSSPDEELLRLAELGELLKKEVL